MKTILLDLLQFTSMFLLMLRKVPVIEGTVSSLSYRGALKMKFTRKIVY
ncbi:hypothetical protein Niako_0002 [Niastella koreensis GR20-10]|uniref:Uncharacterized protein n=1 Tax=Niastella koreensis (strain DSM 17620 / KACC 11465 / NBRC 106392 / GR20-10) TaxID=700598 RepID=G8THJ9_NIAKG|nr:hypothetical protein [Niastella koreensis]AEV96405.1 hypothetical protein Niako_0002 [Niastella koreensis GR20-10]